MSGGAVKGQPWTVDEDAWIRERYPWALPEEAVTALPGRSLSAVKHRASRLGVRKAGEVIAAVNSRTNSGRIRTQENREKISRSLTGKRQSEATRLKRAETLKRVAPRGPANHNWKASGITEDESRWRARRMIPPGPCAVCGKPGMDVHHRDGDPMNNSLDNLVRLCAKHHRQEHARMNRERREREGASA